MEVFDRAEKHFNISIRQDIKDFVKAGTSALKIGYFTVKNVIYEIRAYLVCNAIGAIYDIERPMYYLLAHTDKTMIPVGFDSGNNYFCINNKTGQVYFWNIEENTYNLLAESIDEFKKYLKKPCP